MAQSSVLRRALGEVEGYKTQDAWDSAPGQVALEATDSWEEGLTHGWHASLKAKQGTQSTLRTLTT